jgi:hypothetical protein
MYVCVYMYCATSEKQADSVLYNIMLITQEYDFDLGCGFAG